MSKEINEKQKRFIDYFLELGNATQAAIKAGYSPKAATVKGSQLLRKIKVSEYFQQRQKQLEDVRIATPQEVLEKLTAIARGESASSVIVIEGKGRGISEAREVFKKPSENKRLKALEMLAKRYGLFSENAMAEGMVQVVIVDDLKE